jgi:uncharacterized protein
MLILLSPAKIQNFEKHPFGSFYSIPEFMKEAGQLVKLMRQLSPSELSKLLEINSQLTQLNTDRFLNWHTPFTSENAKQTALIFDGEVFRGLGAAKLTDDELEYAQTHLRILSGLYGILRPMDIIQPYRLEVSSAIENPKGKDLYAFWRKKVTDSVIKALNNSGEPKLILNLASSEYMKTLDLKGKKIKVIDVEFYEYKNDVFKQIVIYTKKARGLMARWVIQNHITNEEDLQGFGEEGYWYSPQMSTNNKIVFVR